MDIIPMALLTRLHSVVRRFQTSTYILHLEKASGNATGDINEWFNIKHVDLFTWTRVVLSKNA